MAFKEFKMYVIILAICFLAPFSKATFYPADRNDEPFSIDEQVAPLGSDVFALFAYGNWVMASDIQQDIPSAMYYGLARLPVSAEFWLPNISFFSNKISFAVS